MMSLSESIVPEFEQEMASTRRTLERVPDEKFDWKPHEKSTSLGGLATHRFGLRRLDAASNQETQLWRGRDKSRPTKALTSQRTPKS
jgi:hypothetical protein